MISRLNIEYLFFRRVAISPLVSFRIIFGALMLFGTLRFMWNGWVSELYIKPIFHFSYTGFEWVKVLPGSWMYLPFFILVLACIGIILGAFYRLSIVLFFVCFTYIELLDKSYYLNHYYFISLVAFCLCFLPANADFSVDAKRNPSIHRDQVPVWCIWLIRMQLGFVYFFAGVAKINADWLLDAQPLKIWLQAYRDLPLVGTWFASSVLAFIFSWFGCLYDLFIPFFLSNAKTRKVAYLAVIVFHILTWLLFPIGVFPWVMIFSTLIFFQDDFHGKVIGFLKNRLKWKRSAPDLERKLTKKVVLSGLVLYLTIQILLPFRYLAYGQNLFWYEDGFRFSWRVMLMHKEGLATFYVRDRKQGGEIEIENSVYLTATQIDQMATQPDMILSYAHFIKERFQDTLLIYGSRQIHLKNPEIRAEIYVSLNGRKSQLYVSKKHDLSQLTAYTSRKSWIEPVH